MKLEIKDTDLPVKQGVPVDLKDPRIVAESEVTARAKEYLLGIAPLHLPDLRTLRLIVLVRPV
jgi:hypothetical protein